MSITLFITIIISFILGGITLIPMLLALLFAFFYLTSIEYQIPIKTIKTTKTKTTIITSSTSPTSSIKDSSLNLNDQSTNSPSLIYRAGWLTIKRNYDNDHSNFSNDGTYVGMVLNGYKAFMDNRSKESRKVKLKEEFFAVLKQNVLFLYDNEEQLDCWVAIELTSHIVSIHPDKSIESELFMKKNAIMLKPIVNNQLSTDPFNIEDLTKEEVKLNAMKNNLEAGNSSSSSFDSSLPWFIFTKVNSDKEDWYFSLVEASKCTLSTAGIFPNGSNSNQDNLVFDSNDMAKLVDGIDRQPDSISVRWLNAMLARVFLGIYRTENLENYITSKLIKKLKRVKTPSILSEVQVKEVNVGTSVPVFSKPMLKNLTADGEAIMEVHVSYVGEFKINIETVATINLGSRFKPYSVRLLLAIVLEEIEGTLLFKIKKPPSNRVWFGFTSMPRLNLKVLPVVSTRQIKWSMITSPIESRIREVIMESIVLPHMDDFPFYDSTGFLHRGGIFNDSVRKEELSEDVPTPNSVGEVDLAQSKDAFELGGSTTVLLDGEFEEDMGMSSSRNEDAKLGKVRKLRKYVEQLSDTPLLPSTSTSELRTTIIENSDLVFTSNQIDEKDTFQSDSSAFEFTKVEKDEKIVKGILSSSSTAPQLISSPFDTSSIQYSEQVYTNNSRVESKTLTESTSLSNNHINSTIPHNPTLPPASSSTQVSNFAQDDQELPAFPSHSIPESKFDIDLSPPILLQPLKSIQHLSRLPPPRRPAPTPASLLSSTPSTSSKLLPILSNSPLIQSWRSKAIESQVVAAGVAQAKNKIKQWGSAWSSTLAAEDQEQESIHQGLASSTGSSASINELDESTTIADGSSPTIHTSAFKSQTTLIIPEQNQLSYNPAAMMKIPGIREPSHRKAVALDHLSMNEL